MKAPTGRLMLSRVAWVAGASNVRKVCSTLYWQSHGSVAVLGSIPAATRGKLINGLKGHALTEGLWNVFFIRKNKDVQPGEEKT